MPTDDSGCAKNMGLNVIRVHMHAIDIFRSMLNGLRVSLFTSHITFPFFFANASHSVGLAYFETAEIFE